MDFESTVFFKHEDPRAWSLTCFENVSMLYIYDSVHRLIVGFGVIVRFRHDREEP